MGCCKVCGCSMSLVGKSSESCHIDHDHKTGKVRGLLCRSCNLALGFTKDSPKILQRLIGYLRYGGVELCH
jgi:hypothetical protein